MPLSVQDFSQMTSPLFWPGRHRGLEWHDPGDSLKRLRLTAYDGPSPPFDAFVLPDEKDAVPDDEKCTIPDHTSPALLPCFSTYDTKRHAFCRRTNPEANRSVWQRERAAGDNGFGFRNRAVDRYPLPV